MKKNAFTCLLWGVVFLAGLTVAPRPTLPVHAQAPLPPTLPAAPSHLLSALPASESCDPQNNVWVLKAPLPQPVCGNGVVSDGTYLYSVGGHSGLAHSNQFARYSLLTDTWSTLPALPAARTNVSAVYAAGKIYVFGGSDSDYKISSSVDVFDVAAGSWSAGVPMPAARQQMSTVTADGKIYLLGGLADSTTYSAQSQVWMFEIATTTWSSLASLPVPLSGAGAGLLDGAIYILGGRGQQGETLNSVYRYDLAANTWSSREPIPFAVNYPASVVYQHQIWLMGGGTPLLSQGIQSLNTVQVYDPRLNSWHNGPEQHVARSFQGATVLMGQIVSAGGYESITGRATSAVEALWQQPLKILVVYADMSFDLADLPAQLIPQPGVGLVDTFNAESATPTLTSLLAYDVVVTSSVNAFDDPTTLGDNLAAYHDAGGVVVNFAFSFYDTTQVGGQWESGGYSALATTSTTAYKTSQLGSYLQGHPLMSGVNDLQAYYRLVPGLNPGAFWVAYWKDGRGLIAVKNHAVGVNAYVGDFGGQWSGDFARLVVNAGIWLRGDYTSCLATVCSKGATVSAAITASDAALSTRLQRDDPPGTCAATPTCQVWGAGSFAYDLYAYINNDSHAQCVTVTLDPRGCTSGSGLHSAAYSSFDPADLCANFLGDLGLNQPTADTYSFMVPAWQTYQVIVYAADSGATCPLYTLSLRADNCSLKHNFLPVTLR